MSDTVVVPALLRVSRRTYGNAIRRALAAVGCDDMPRNGSYVVGAIARTGSPLSDIIPQLGVSKQAAGQLIDTLVGRGYLEREPDPEDRRRMNISLTERGEMAAVEGRKAVEAIDAELLDRVGPERFDAGRMMLAELIAIGDEQRAAEHDDQP
jgi:DNA-binding MarR family transcriptional regulator